jgi:hypothetical protein
MTDLEVVAVPQHSQSSGLDERNVEWLVHDLDARLRKYGQRALAHVANL